MTGVERLRELLAEPALRRQRRPKTNGRWLKDAPRELREFIWRFTQQEHELRKELNWHKN